MRTPSHALVVGLALLLCQDSLTWAQFLPAEPPELNEEVTLDLPDLDRDRFEFARTQIENAAGAQQWTQAATALRELAEAFGAQPAPLAPNPVEGAVYRAYLPWKAVAARQFMQVDPAARREALRGWDATVRVQLRGVAPVPAPEALAALRRRYLPAPTALETTVLEARLNVDRGRDWEFLEGLTALELLEPDWPDRYPDLRVAQMLALESVGDAARSGALLGADAARIVEYQGRRVSLAEVVAAAREAPTDTRPTLLPWQTSGGSFARRGLQPAIGAPGAFIAAIPHGDLVEGGASLGALLSRSGLVQGLRRLLPGGREEARDRLNPRFLLTQDSARLWIHGDRRVRKIRLEDGKHVTTHPVEDGRSAEDLPSASGGWQSFLESLGGAAPIRWYQNTHHEGLLHSVSYPRGRMLSRYSGNSLVCWDTEAGQVRWQVPPSLGSDLAAAFRPEERAFLGAVQFSNAPVVAGEAVIVGATRPSASDLDYHALAFDRRTGAPLWRTHLGSTFRLNQRNPLNVIGVGDVLTEMPPPVLVGPLVVFASNRGFIAALAWSNGELAWAAKYRPRGRGQGGNRSWFEQFDGRRAETSGGLGWFDGTVRLVGGLVLVTPMDSDRILAIEPMTGRLRWQHHEPALGRYLIGATDQHFYYQRADHTLVMGEVATGRIVAQSAPWGEAFVGCAALTPNRVIAPTARRLALFSAADLTPQGAWDLAPAAANGQNTAGDVRLFQTEAGRFLATSNEWQVSIWRASDP